MNQEIENTIKSLKNGGVILYPTDTIWGLGCDANNDEAIKRIFKIKKRLESKLLICLVSDKEMLKSLNLKIPNINLTQYPTTIIYSNAQGVSKLLINKIDNSTAIRIPKDKFCQKLIKRFGGPITSTSANLSGDPFPKNFLDINNEIINSVDYIVNLRKEETMINPSKIYKIGKSGNIIKIR